LSFAYIYEYFKKIADRFDDIDAGIDGLNMWVRRELEDIKKGISEIELKCNKRRK
jgi:hypothetical protein